MTPDQLQAALKEIELRLKALKQQNSNEYGRLLKEFGDALEDFNNNIRLI